MPPSQHAILCARSGLQVCKVREPFSLRVARWNLGWSRPQQLASVYPICYECCNEIKLGILEKTLLVYSVHLHLNTSAHVGPFVWNISTLKLHLATFKALLKCHFFHDLFLLSPIFSRLPEILVPLL